MSRTFGKIAQIGYVVRDIDDAMDNWVKHGVGPWFYVDRVQTDYFRYRGVDSDMQMSVALANSGDVQSQRPVLPVHSRGRRGLGRQRPDPRTGVSTVDLSRSGFRSVAGRGGWQEAGAWLTDRVHRGREWARYRPL